MQIFEMITFPLILYIIVGALFPGAHVIVYESVVQIVADRADRVQIERAVAEDSAKIKIMVHRLPVCCSLPHGRGGFPALQSA